MAKLIVTRSSEWTNRGRAINIYLDGQKLGPMKNGATQEFDIPDGIHSLQAKIDWCGSRNYSFMVTDNDTKTIRISSFGYYVHFTPICMAVIALYFFLHFMLHLDYFIWVVFLIIPVQLYFLTFGRNDYLLVRETDWQK